MSNLSLAQLGPVSPLTDLARSLIPIGYIADQVMPPMMVSAESGQITVWDDTARKIPSDAKRAVGARSSAGTDPIPTYMSYTLQTYARHLALSPRELDKVSNGQGMGGERLRAAKVRKIFHQLSLLREYDLATKLTTDANYESGYSTDESTVWTSSSSTPLVTIDAGKAVIEAGGVFPNVAIMDIAVWRALEKHGAFLEMLKYTKSGKMDEAGFQAITGLKPIISYARYNNAGTSTAVWGDSFIIAYVADSGLMDINDTDSEMTLGRTLMKEPLSFVEIEDRLADHKPGAVLIEGQTDFCHQFIGVDNATDGDTIAAYHIDDCV